MDFTTALGKLLSDRALRSAFCQDPSGALDQLEIDDTTRSSLLQLDPASLQRQAEGLISKRRSAVAAIISTTWQKNSDDAAELFNHFASESWPSGYQRHRMDALEFCKHLRRLGRPVHRPEFRWLRFELGNAWLRVYLSSDLKIRERRHFGVQFFYRWRNEPCWYAFGFPMGWGRAQ